jgi:hypothetical protein
MNLATFRFLGSLADSHQKLDTSFEMNLAGKLLVTADPMKTVELRMGDKKVGFIKGTREEGNSLIADCVITDPEAIKILNANEHPTISAGYNEVP